MAVLLNAVTTSTTGSDNAMTAPCTVHVSGGFSGDVAIQAKTANTSYETLQVLQGPSVFNVDIYGSYTLRALSVLRSGSSAVTVDAVEKT